jgi:hypothetical protein
MAQGDSPASGWATKRLTWGLITAVAVGVLSVLVDQGGTQVRLGALITLAGVLLAVAVECYFSITETKNDQSRHADAVRRYHLDMEAAVSDLAVLARAPQELRDFIREVARAWEAIEGVHSLLLHRILEDQRLEFQSKLSALSNGQVTMDRQSWLQFRSSSLDDLVTMRGISATNPAYWRTPQGIRYLANQRRAIDAGLTIHRVIVLPHHQIPDWFDIVEQQRQAGVHVTIVLREQVEPDDSHLLAVDRFLITDKAGVRGALFYGSGTEGLTFTNDEAQIRETDRILDNFRAYERSPESLYPGLSSRRTDR